MDSILDSVNLNYFFDKALAVGDKALSASVVFILGLVVIKLLLMFVDKTLSRAQLDNIVLRYLRLCVKVVAFVMLAFIVLSTLGVSIVSLVAVLSAACAAIALALQDSLAKLAAGILIIINKPFNQGDYIECDSCAGVVDEIHLFNCRLHTVDNKFVVVPNNILMDSVITNASSVEKRRVDLKVCIGYDDDIDKARQVLLQISAANPLILAEPQPFVGVSAHLDSSVELDFKVWTQPDNYWPVYYYLQEEVLKHFKRENINIPYPQLDVHISKEA